MSNNKRLLERLNETHQKAFNVSSTDQIGRPLLKTVALLLEIVNTDADPEKVNTACRSLREERLLAERSDPNRNDPLRDVIYGISESVELTTEWLAEREGNRLIDIDIKMEDEDAFNFEDNYAAGAEEAAIKEEPIDVIDPGFAVKEEEEEWNDDTEYPLFHNDFDDRELKDEPEEIMSERSTSKGKDLASLVRRTKRVTDTKTAPGQYQCGICGKICSRKDVLDRHRLTHLENKEKSKPFQCDQCEKRCRTRSDLASHKKTHLHVTDKSFYQCDICGKKMTQANMKRHKAMHAGQQEGSRQVQECDECGKTFTSLKNLKEHMKIHSGDEVTTKPYACDECGWRFRKQFDLTSHKNTHLPFGDPRRRKFECDVCAKPLSSPYALKWHKDTHLGKDDPLRKFPCNKCEMRFTRIPELQRHERIHHPEQ